MACGEETDRLEMNARERKSLVLLKHHSGRLDHDRDLVSLLQTKLFRAAARDHALDLVLPDSDDDMGHDVPKLHFYDFSLELVSR